MMLAVVSLFGSAASARAEAIELTLQKPGVPPPNFEFWRADQVDFGHWSVVRDPTVHDGSAIQESTPDRSDRPSLAVYQLVSAANIRVRARFKLIDGKLPSAGIAVRVTSPQDYYLVRVSAFEGRVSLVRVHDGAAEEIAGADADIAEDHWQTLEVVADGDGFTVSLDDRWVLTAFDRHAVQNGKIALWTEKSDVTQFDQVEISSAEAVTN
jgi:Domain of Unknown Function (DUF1080)